MERIKNSLNWFEIPVLDFERARKFYGNIYEFEMPDVMLGKNRMGFFPVEQGGIGGAIVNGLGYQPSESGSLIYLNAGDDLLDILNRVESAGGKIVTEKTHIAENLGYFAVILDTEGNKVALHSMN